MLPSPVAAVVKVYHTSRNNAALRPTAAPTAGARVHVAVGRGRGGALVIAYCGRGAKLPLRRQHHRPARVLTARVCALA